MADFELNIFRGFLLVARNTHPYNAATTTKTKTYRKNSAPTACSYQLVPRRVPEDYHRSSTTDALQVGWVVTGVSQEDKIRAVFRSVEQFVVLLEIRSSSMLSSTFNVF